MKKDEKQFLMNMAKKFTGHNDAFIHSEMKNGETQQVVSGSVPGIVHACYVALHRTAELSHIDLNFLVSTLVNEYEIETGKQFEYIHVDFPNTEDGF